jgi:hypothetical protein
VEAFSAGWVRDSILVPVCSIGHLQVLGGVILYPNSGSEGRPAEQPATAQL